MRQANLPNARFPFRVLISVTLGESKVDAFVLLVNVNVLKTGSRRTCVLLLSPADPTHSRKRFATVRLGSLHV